MNCEHETRQNIYMQTAANTTLAVGIGLFALGSEVSTSLMGRGALMVTAGLALKGLHRLYKGPFSYDPTEGLG